jgi:uncharacterized membrane protein YfcA
MSTVILGLTAYVTALLSGVFGMAGGMLLMGVYTALLPVPTAMVLHGGTQLLSNALRARILVQDVYWRGVGFYVLGASAAFLALRQLHFVPEPLLVFAGLGLCPFIAAALPARWFDFERAGSAFACGAQVAGIQLLAGAAGPLLDIAFIETRLTRTQVVATKAVTQVFSHGLKLAYFVPLVGQSNLAPALLAATGVATIAGTYSGTRILRRLDDDSFRRYSRAIIYGIGVFYLCKAGALLLR